MEGVQREKGGSTPELKRHILRYLDTRESTQTEGMSEEGGKDGRDAASFGREARASG